MTTPIDISPEAVEAVGYENYNGTLYGYANHKNYADNPGAIPVRIIREADYQALRLQLTASEKRVAELEPGAECWAALSACARIKLTGSAGLDKDSPLYESDFAHIGLEFWTHHEAKGDAQDINGRDLFVRFMFKALAAFRAAGRKP